MYNVGREVRKAVDPVITDVPYDSDIYIGTILRNSRRYIYLRGNLAVECLNGLSSVCQSRLLNEIFTGEQDRFLKLVVDFRSKSGNNFIYLKNTENNKESDMGDISIRIHGSSMHWVDLRVDEREWVSERFEMENEEDMDGQDSIIIDKNGDTYVIEDYTDGVPELLDADPMEEEYLIEYLNSKFRSTLLRQIFDICLSKNIQVSYYFTPPKRKEARLKVTMFPFLNTRLKRILLYFRLIKKMPGFLQERKEEENPYEQRKQYLFSKMTPREKEVAEELLKGKTNRVISEKLFITEGTVKKIVYNIYRKFDVTTRVEFVTLLMNNETL